MDTFFSSLNYYIQFLIFYIPLGLIGIWRWSVWVFRKVISLFYHPPKGKYQTAISLVVPVYNEDPKTFRLALDSWKINKPEEIIAVIDYKDKSSINIFKKFSKDFSGAKLIITNKPGKRPALVDGAKASSGEIIAFVDSDTIWSSKIKNKIIGPFADPQVGGLVTRQDVLNPDTLARKLFKILLDDRYLFEYPFLATVSDAMLCLSGRTAVYRRTAIIDEMNKLEGETFWGEKMISGDDKSLTNFIHARGWKSRYLKNVTVYTTGIPDMMSYLKQKVRWSRNGLRSDSKILLSNWIWKKNKMLALHMLDKFVSPITLLIGFSYFIISLYLGHWQFALLIASWWIVSRIIKIFPHLKERPADILLLPIYIIATLVIAVIKIYALITINKQDWITRWDKSRLKKFSLFESFFTYTATFSIVFGIFFSVSLYHNAIFETTPQKTSRSSEAPIQNATSNQQTFSIFTPEKTRPSENELENISLQLSKENQSDAYGYYIIKTGETLPILQQRFNLSSTEKILDANTKLPIATFDNFNEGKKIAISIKDLRNPLDLNLLNKVAKPPRVDYDSSTNTIFVKEGGSISTLSKINQSLAPANKNLLEQTAPGEWILRANLYIGKDVTLILDKGEVDYLKLKSDDDEFIWLRSETGNMLFSGIKITSWDEKNKTPDFNHNNGRAYITAKNSGRFDIANSELAYLGYVGAPKRGGPFGGSYGVSWKIKNQGLQDRLLTGVVQNSDFHNNFFGAYTFGTTGMVFQKNKFYDNIEYGLDPHDDSNNMLIENNLAFQNGKHGIITSKRCFDNIIINNTSYNNRLHGIMLDRNSNNNLVQKNTVYGNVDGIAIYESNKNIISENKIQNNVRGIRLNAGSQENFIQNNSITKNSLGLYIYNQANKNIAINNSIVNNETGINLKNANQNTLLDNFKSTENRKDGRVNNDAYENIIQ
ncbi:MAG: Glycosyl transferase family 2 [Candidatus Moranbacteria bacterium GW2011_GWF2_34_56]|nr:MAG: Glycosyl transferase family 2 [Candidatus Moranbacteria bacterium GW2011_GWF1_34_10]KKP64169.1 MAG: Glycosyl transferase family 2 [Candidatus Moranbacteria bacterium GW2011_GWF2_34_56]